MYCSRKLLVLAFLGLTAQMLQPATAQGAPFMKIGFSSATPAGYRDATCQEAQANQASVVALLGYLEICSTVGGTARGSRQGFDSAPASTVLCPDNDPPSSFGCRIVVRDSCPQVPGYALSAYSDHPGDDIDTFSSSDAQAAGNACATNPLCVAVAVRSDVNKYFLKSKKDSLTGNNNVCFYTKIAAISCPQVPGYALSAYQDRPDYDIGSYSGSDAQTAGNACAAIPSCVGVAVSPVFNQYFLKTKAGPLVGNNNVCFYTKVGGTTTTTITSTYLGCYGDSPTRALPAQLFSGGSAMSLEQCITLAAASGYAYAGAQAGDQCYAGNDLVHAKMYGATAYGGGQAACNAQCSGNPSETCGGAWANQLYAITFRPKMFMKVGFSSAAPAGFRDATCQEAQANQASVVSLLGYLDICSTIGGTARGSRQGFDSGPGSTVLCPDNNPPSSFGCRILVQGSA